VPELPEVETIRRQLERELVGRKIVSIKVKSSSVVKGARRYSLLRAMEQAVVTGVARAGKYLVICLSTGHRIVIHLGMSGQLLFSRASGKQRGKGQNGPREGAGPEKHEHMSLSFDDRSTLRMVDPRRFGKIILADQEQVPEIESVGFDPLASPLPWQAFAAMLAASGAQLKAVLLDQSFMAGLGNVYTDEVLFAAGIRPDRKPSSLSPQEVRRLYRAIGEVLSEAIRMRGSTLADQQYVDIYGRPGEYQLMHSVYGREGQPCRRCRARIVRAKIAGRSTYFCPSCQI
jgi:formamidopyrimidine-DNA glycosylase